MGANSFAYAASTYNTQDLHLAGAGGVSLDATIYIPKVTPAPAILLAHGFTGDKNSVAAQAKELAAHGYVVLAWTARGFGSSTGEISMNSPTGEVADVSALINYLSSSKEVIQQSKNDPLVGITGDSYGGAISLLVAGYDKRIDALAANITWNNLTHSLFPQNANDPSLGPYKEILGWNFLCSCYLA